MQLDNVSRRQYHNSLQCLRSLLRTDGATVLYTGFGVNAMRETVYLGTYFCCYEGMRELLIDHCFSLQYAVPLAGGLAGSIGWLVSFPLDCIRARVQGQGQLTLLGNSEVHRKTAFEIAKLLWKERGVVGLYAGVTPSIIRAFLVSGVRFSAFECAMYVLTGKRYHDS
jgi:solute carrier family 25 carnitine/acylcarnitine transporter 20/29